MGTFFLASSRSFRFKVPFTCVVFLAAMQLTTFTRSASASPDPRTPQSAVPLNSVPPSTAPAITVPPETKVPLAVTRPAWARTAAVGDQIYAITEFPVALNGEMAIPAGTYAQGVIDAITKPTWKSPHAEFQIHFTKLVFANGYVIELPAGAATSTAYVQVSAASDILLDNGSPLEMTLRNPVSLDAKKIADAVRLSKPPQITQFKSATRCVPTSGTPGTSDTVIPGTPPTIIPGAMGMPDTVIPGTSTTIIPGTPGTSGTSCAAPPIVSSTPIPQGIHKESFRVTSPFTLAGQKFPAGNYDVEWLGVGPTASVDILEKKVIVSRVQARIGTLDKKAAKSEVTLQPNADGSVSLNSMQFKGNTVELVFN